MRARTQFLGVFCLASVRPEDIPNHGLRVVYSKRPVTPFTIARLFSPLLSWNFPEFEVPPSLTFMSNSGLGLIAFTPCPTLSAAWLTKTEASVGRTEHVTACDSPTATVPSDGDIVKGGGTVH